MAELKDLVKQLKLKRHNQVHLSRIDIKNILGFCNTPDKELFLYETLLDGLYNKKDSESISKDYLSYE